MEKDRYFKDWNSLPEKNLDLNEDEETTKPLNNVKAVRNFATQINILQLSNFTDEDEEVGEVFTNVRRDVLVGLSSEVLDYLNSEEFNDSESESKVFVSAISTDLYFGIESGNKRIKYVFDPRIIYLISRKEILEDGIWFTDKEDLPNEYSDPDKILEIFKNQLGLIG